MTSSYITTTIPYVNARPHLGFALELVQADVLARYHRDLNEQVRFQAGTDDNSLKNVLAAQAAGIGVQEFVDANAAAFIGLAEPLSLSVDDLIRTSTDPRHRAGVERLWRACAASGDLYRKHYEGLYCVGCEQFYTTAELTAGRCPEHGTVPDLVSEENWFFRLSRYAGRLRGLIADDTIRIQPAERRNEVLAFIDAGLADFSVSRGVERARGWGIPVPVTRARSSTSGGTRSATTSRRWTTRSAARTSATGGPARHGASTCSARGCSGSTPCTGPRCCCPPESPCPPTSSSTATSPRTAARSASQAVPRRVSTADPYDLAGRYGTDAVRWWLLREVPRGADADFTPDRLVARANDELANGFGNLVNRVVSMIHRYHDGRVPPRRRARLDAPALDAAISDAPGLIAAALEDFDFRRATEAVWRIADEANRYVNRTRPWDLAKAGERAELAAVLSRLLRACQAAGEHLRPFLPDAATRITAQCTTDASGCLPPALPLLPRTPRPSAGHVERQLVTQPGG